MLCRVEMPTNEQIYGRFYRYKLLRGSAGQKRGGSVLWMPLLLLALCLVMAGFTQSYTLPLALAVVVVAYLVYLLVLKPNSLFRKLPGAALQTEVTIFTDTGLNRSVRSEEAGVVDTSSMQYSALYAAVETGKDFYLYTGPGQAYLIDKAYFDKGSPDELRATLKKAMGAKFKTKA